MVLERLCLKPTYTLRKQLLLSFGIISFVFIGFVSLVVIVTVIYSSEEIKSRSTELYGDHVETRLASTSTDAANAIYKKMESYESSVSILAETVKDRFAGYPYYHHDFVNNDGNDDDTDARVPFLDTDSKQNKYPLNLAPLPLDWKVYKNEGNGTTTTKIRTLDTAIYFMQGACDPDQMDQSSPTYYQNCDKSNNDVSKGGALQPTGYIHSHIYNKAKDLNFILKPLYEFHDAIDSDYSNNRANTDSGSSSIVEQIGIYFVNDGAGSAMVYPGIVFGSDPNRDTSNGRANDTDQGSYYSSIGCDYLHQTKRMFYNHDIEKVNLTEEMKMKQHCHKKGTMVPIREYNPLEREWCRDQILNPNMMRTYGPYRSAINSSSTSSSDNNNNDIILTFGQSVLDRHTNEVIACTLIDVSTKGIQNFMKHGLSMMPEVLLTFSVLIRNDSFGTVVASTLSSQQEERSNNNKKTGLMTITDLETFMGVDTDTYNEIRSSSVKDGGNTSNGSTGAYNKEQYEEHIERRNNGTLMHRNGYIITYHFLEPPLLGNESNNSNDDDIYLHQHGDKAEFILITSMKESVLNEHTRKMGEKTSDRVKRIIIATLTKGCIGLVFLTIIIYFVSTILSQPLVWLQRVCEKIVGNAGGVRYEDITDGMILSEHTDSSGRKSQFSVHSRNSIDTTDGSKNKSIKCFSFSAITPKTELTKLESDFGLMLDYFRAEGAAKTAKIKIGEIHNKFRWKVEYNDLYDENGGNILYQCHMSKDNTPDSVLQKKVSIAEDAAISNCDSGSKIGRIDMPIINVENESSLSKYIEPSSLALKPIDEHLGTTKRCILNYGKNAVDGKLARNNSHEEDSSRLMVDRMYFKVMISSPLFWWVAVLIAVPVLVTMLSISIWDLDKVLNILNEWVAEVEILTIKTEKKALALKIIANSLFAQEVMTAAVRDLFLYTRVAGWLLFDGLSRSDSFTEVKSVANECKIYGENISQQCPFGWEDPCPNFSSVLGNNNHTEVDSRYLQRRSFSCPSSDADPITGERLNSTYPAIDFSPQETMWYDELSLQNGEMPGSHKGKLASGYNTTYDRIRVLSAIAVIEFALYNYKRVSKNTPKHIFSYIGFEADGSYTGYSGCGETDSGVSAFLSSESNGAANLQPELCPIGKYGYDCRCRAWYATGKEKKGLHVSPPYLFSVGSTIACTATLSLIDPITSTHVGQAAIDFLPNELVEKYGQENERESNNEMNCKDDNNSNYINRFFFLITTDSEASDGEAYGGDVVVGPSYTISNNGSMPIAHVVLPGNDTKTASKRKEFNDNVIKFMKEGNRGNGTFTRRRSCKINEQESSLNRAVENNRNIDKDEEDFIVSFAPVYVTTLEAIDHSDFTQGCNISKTLVYSLAMAVRASDLKLPYQRIYQEVGKGRIDTVRTILLWSIIVGLIFVFFITYTITAKIIEPALCLAKIMKLIKRKDTKEDIPELPHGASLEAINVYESFKNLYMVVQLANSAHIEGNIKQSKTALLRARDYFKQSGNQKAVGVACNNLGLLSLQSSDANNDFYEGKEYFDEAICIAIDQRKQAQDTKTEKDYLIQEANRYFNRGMFLISNNQYNIGRDDILTAKKIDELVGSKKGAMTLFEEEVQEVEAFDILLRRVACTLSLMQNNDLDDVLDVKALISKANQILSKHWDTPESKLFSNILRVGRRQQISNLRIQHSLLLGDARHATEIGLKTLAEDEYILERTFATAVTAINIHFKGHTKNVIFCLDRSASMGINEKKKIAKRSIQNIYKKYCRDEDFVGFVPFNNHIDEELTFPLQRKLDFLDHHQRQLNQTLTAEGGSNLYTALDYCVNLISSISLYNGSSFIMAFTDGDSWDEPDRVFSRIKLWNANNIHQIHLIMIGMDVSRTIMNRLKSEIRKLSVASRIINVSTTSSTTRTKTPKTLIGINNGNGYSIEDDIVDGLAHCFQTPDSVILSGGVTMEMC